MNGPYDREDDFDEDSEDWYDPEDDECPCWDCQNDPFQTLSPLIERVREYVQVNPSGYTPDVVRDVEAVTRYIERGVEDFERLLANHAAFDAYLAERGDVSA